MEALDGLAVAAQDILARTTAPLRTRENRARAGDSVRFAHREPASPAQCVGPADVRGGCGVGRGGAVAVLLRSLAD